MTSFDIIEHHTKRIRDLVAEIDRSKTTEIERTLTLMVAHLTSAVEALAAHVAAQATDGK